MSRIKVVILVVLLVYGINTIAQNRESQCEQYYKDAKSAYDKEDYEVALIFFNKLKTENCNNVDLQIYIDICNKKLATNNNTVMIVTGVEINGLIWATCNVCGRNTFCPTPEDYGNYYTWEQAQTACPSGWHLPSKEEFESLIPQKNVWVTQNGVKGRKYGSDSNPIFFSAAGEAMINGDKELVVSDIGVRSNYWSSTERKRSFSYFMYFNHEEIRDTWKFMQYPVRCVADKK